MLEPVLKVMVPEEGVNVPVTLKAPPTAAVLALPEIEPLIFKPP